MATTTDSTRTPQIPRHEARRPVAVIHPTKAEMRAAYRRNGDPIPANLCRFGGLFGSVRA